MTAREFTDIYRPLEGQMYALALHFLESAPDAEDAVQDLYVKLWNRRDALDAITNPRAYCCTLVRNICIDRIRKASSAPSRVQPVDIPSESSADAGAISEEALARVTAALKRLPARQREVLELKVFEELDYQEIAERTGLGYLSLRVILSKARKSLKELL